MAPGIGVAPSPPPSLTPLRLVEVYASAPLPARDNVKPAPASGAGRGGGGGGGGGGEDDAPPAKLPKHLRHLAFGGSDGDGDDDSDDEDDADDEDDGNDTDELEELPPLAETTVPRRTVSTNLFPAESRGIAQRVLSFVAPSLSASASTTTTTATTTTAAAPQSTSTAATTATSRAVPSAAKRVATAPASSSLAASSHALPLVRSATFDTAPEPSRYAQFLARPLQRSDAVDAVSLTTIEMSSSLAEGGAPPLASEFTERYTYWTGALALHFALVERRNAIAQNVALATDLDEVQNDISLEPASSDTEAGEGGTRMAPPARVGCVHGLFTAEGVLRGVLSYNKYVVESASGAKKRRYEYCVQSFAIAPSPRIETCAERALAENYFLAYFERFVQRCQRHARSASAIIIGAHRDSLLARLLERMLYRPLARQDAQLRRELFGNSAAAADAAPIVVLAKWRTSNDLEPPLGPLARLGSADVCGTT